MYPDITFVISIAALVIPIVALIITIWHFNESQKNMQIKFNQTNQESNKLQFIKRIEHYEDSFLELSVDFLNTPQQMKHCVRYANRWLLLLDRLSFFKLHDLVDQDFIQFFELRYRIGKQHRDWLAFMHNREPDFINRAFLSFIEVENTLNYSSSKLVETDTSFLYYKYKLNEDPNYDASLDTFDPRLWKKSD